MVTLEQLRLYLRIDSTYEDELLESFLKVARLYLNEAVTDFETNYEQYSGFAEISDLLMLVLATELYQNRDNSAHTFSYTVRSLILQLQCFEAEKEQSKCDKE